MTKNHIKCIDFSYNLDNNLNLDEKDYITNIIKKEKITQIHIHQYSCILTILPICLMNNIPYVAYVHHSNLEPFDWYIKTYPNYNIYFNLYFHNATKIIAITDIAANNISKYFNVSYSKIKVIHNSINLKNYKSTKKVKSLNNFIILSRFSQEKIISIKNGIDLYVKFYDRANNKNLKLDIYGDGNSLKEIKDYIKDISKKYNINLYGKTNEVAKVLDKYDVVIGIGRCILEGITMQKIAIISGVYELKYMITPNNIVETIKENFVAEFLKSKSADEIVSDLLKLDESAINDITQKNYSIINKKLDIKKNIFYLQDCNITYNKDVVVNLFNLIKKNQDDYKNLQKQLKETIDSHEKIKIYNNQILEELNNIKNSKRYKFVNKLAKLKFWQ